MVLFVMVVAYLQNQYGSLFRAKEQFLMQLSGWPQMDDHMWIQLLAVSLSADTHCIKRAHFIHVGEVVQVTHAAKTSTSSSHCVPTYLTSCLC